MLEKICSNYDSAAYLKLLVHIGRQRVPNEAFIVQDVVELKFLDRKFSRDVRVLKLAMIEDVTTVKRRCAWVIPAVIWASLSAQM